MNESKYPTGWDAERVKAILDFYEGQTAEEAIAEDEAAYEAPTHTLMSVPVGLVPQVRDLIVNYVQP